MDHAELKRIVNDNIREICHLSQMQVFATSYYQKNYFQRQIDHRTEELLQQLDLSVIQTVLQEEPVPREFTVEELAEFNGEDGKPVYVAVNGKVYDLSSAAPWAGGKHNSLTAGQDLSSWFMNCHMGFTAVLEKYPFVGTLKTNGAE